MKYEIKVITPDEAKKILEKNTNNRHVTSGHVDFLYAQMRSGQWVEGTGDAIRFNSNGELIDGQHRLLALIKANKAYSFLIIKEVPDAAFSVIDTGRKRTLGDVVSIAGFKDSTNLGAAARMIILHRNSEKGLAVMHVDAGVLTKATGIAEISTNSKIIEFLKKTDLTEAMSFANKMYKNCRLLRKSEWCFLYFIFSEKSEQDASEFLTMLSSGANIPEKSAILYARQKLEMSATRTVTLTQKAKQFYIFRAWNAWRTGDPIYVLRYDPQKTMPVIV